MKKELPGMNMLKLNVDRIDQEENVDIVEEVVTKVKRFVDTDVVVYDE